MEFSDFGAILHRNLERSKADRSELIAGLTNLKDRAHLAHRQLPFPGDAFEMSADGFERQHRLAEVLSDASLLALYLIELLQPHSSSELEIQFKRRRPGQPRDWEAWERDARKGNIIARRVERMVAGGIKQEAAIFAVQQSPIADGWLRKDVFHWLGKRRKIRDRFESMGTLNELEIKQLLLSNHY